MCLSIALTAARLGANVGNHVEVVELLKCEDCETGKTEVSGARVKDTQTGNNNDNNNFCLYSAIYPINAIVQLRFAMNGIKINKCMFM